MVQGWVEAEQPGGGFGGMEGDWLAREVYQAMRLLWRNSKMTDYSTTESVVNLAHWAVQRVELSTNLTAFLEFVLETANGVVKSKATLARWAQSPWGCITGRR